MSAQRQLMLFVMLWAGLQISPLSRRTAMLQSLFEPCAWAAASLFFLSGLAAAWWLGERWREWRRKQYQRSRDKGHQGKAGRG